MKCLSFRWTTAVLAATLLTTASSAQGASPHGLLSESGDDGPSPSGFIPAEAILVKELRVDLDGNGTNEIALAYGFDSEPNVNTGVRILKRGASGWAVVFEESDSLINGAGPSDAVDIEEVSSPEGKDGVVVILKNSGAGTTTDWHLLASIKGKVVRLESAGFRDTVLKGKGYIFNGYNGVKVSGDLVIEDIPGYSPRTARCCPDKPSIAITTRFTASSLRLGSVKTLPFKTPQ